MKKSHINLHIQIFLEINNVEVESIFKFFGRIKMNLKIEFYYIKLSFDLFSAFIFQRLIENLIINTK